MFFRRTKAQQVDDNSDAKNAHLKCGKMAELYAKKHLESHGLKVIQSNYFCRFGEIDLIAKESSTLVFVEVRARKVGAMISAAESISIAKQKKVIRTAQHYLQQFDEIPDCRFDVIAITHQNNKVQEISWLKSCF